MPETPEFPQNVFAPHSEAAEPVERPRPARRIPNLGHTLIFLLVIGVVLFLTESATVSIAMGMHLFGGENFQRLLREPRLLVAGMALSYLIAGTLVWAIFTALWRLPFTLCIRWNFSFVQRRFYHLIAAGILLSGAVQFLSNYLPIPKTLPIDDFFRTSGDVWLVAVFGTFLAPVFEELAFRGFLLPSLATAWDWMTRRSIPKPSGGGDGVSTDPAWSVGAMVFSTTVTSVAFALLHADQLAHARAPLAVLFAVSAVLCLARLRTHSLAAAALLHATYNGTIFTLLFYGTDGFRHLDKING